MEFSVKIDYENIPTQSNSIRNYAKEINMHLINIYRKVSEMHIYWYGKRYNELVAKFNELVPKLNQFLDVIVTEVPYIFETIANNFSEVDIQQNVSVPQKESVKRLQEIEIIDDVGMRYQSNDIEKIKREIEKELINTKETMNIMNKTVEKIELECCDAQEFRGQLNKLSYSFEYVLNMIQTQFVELMNKDRELIEKAEKSNTQ